MVRHPRRILDGTFQRAVNLPTVRGPVRMLAWAIVSGPSGGERRSVRATRGWQNSITYQPAPFTVSVCLGRTVCGEVVTRGDPAEHAVEATDAETAAMITVTTAQVRD
jgi:hypothetical protein